MHVLRFCLLLACVAFAAAVDRSKFRKCSDASFCNRHRGKTSEPQFVVDRASVKVDAAAGLLTGTVRNNVENAPPFKLTVAFYKSGIARVRIVEHNDLPPRWESPDVIVPTGTAPTSIKQVSKSDAVVAKVLSKAADGMTADSHILIHYALPDNIDAVLALQLNPLKVDLYIDGFTTPTQVEPAISLNERGLSYIEHRRLKVDSSAVASDTAAAAAAGTANHEGRRILDWGEDGKPIYEDGSHGDDPPGTDELAKGAGDAAEGRELLSAASKDAEPGMWEETFQTHRDSKPHGPTSVGMDLTFPTATHVYGIPEHASTHALRATDGSEGTSEYKEPYRLYNLDVFEYELDNPMALYGSIPVMIAHSPAGNSVGVFWNNPTETYVDITKGVRNSGSRFSFILGGSAAKVGTATRWISESGVFDVSLVPGPEPKQVISQYTSLTGRQELPPLFSLGYHQCRWNYKDEADVFHIDEKFEEHAFPYDVIWLDIEHTDGKRYFTWDNHLFSNPGAMQDKLAARGHKMVTIIDPHIKRDSNYKIHSEASSKGLYIRNANGGEYDGWCWPGSSSYLDFTNEKVRNWWAEQFALDNYKGSTLSLYTWNDMNEPSVFNGPEVSMNKDAKSIDGVEHREWHNMYGFYQQMATAQGQIQRTPSQNVRPFVLSRAFYAGSQRFGAIWTGDNAANWEHLAMASPMLLTIGAAGLTFSGADVGGFFNNPSTELMTRWYQAGAFQPFFRAHAHIDTARREPWLFGDDVLATLRDIVKTRYTYLPLWYTLFAEASRTGVPTMRPLWTEYPKQQDLFDVEDEWLVGSDLLVKPVTSAGTTSVEVVFPGTEAWFDTLTYEKQLPGKRSVSAPLNKIPVYQRAGSIVPRQMRPRRASALMARDPYTLVAALDSSHSASGQLYLDDGNTFDYRSKQIYQLRAFKISRVANGVYELVASRVAGSDAFSPSNTVEKIVIVGVVTAPKSVEAMVVGAVSRKLEFTFDAATQVLSIRKPDLPVAAEWTVRIA